MAARLIKHLEEKAKTHSHIELLKAQWTFDQELIPKALQNVGMIFPHYSRHDASHSRQILVNIERLLGDSIEKLTATDTWLILESAYWHDIGMLVSSDEIIRDIESKEFKAYARRVSESNGHELKNFAKGYVSAANGNCFSGSDHPQDAVEKFRQLLAGWYRQRHAQRASQIVDDPWREAGISSPRNELLPKRLFRILGNICKLHGSSFKDLMDQLSYCEAGMGSEDCHPRFVACLLRLGDLLDLDDNRFCPVMQRVAGNLPPSSQAHVHKHASIRHFRLDRERIEVFAVCDSTDGYVETVQWFRWLEQEVQQQMSRWNDIVPEREFGLLPTLGELKVDLNGPNIVLEQGQRPQFGIDPLKALELMQGAGLYSEKNDSVRELLQNAIDATLIYVWYTFGVDEEREKWESPNSEFVKEILGKYPINVSLKKTGQKVVNGKSCWELTIDDNGAGISRSDLGHMLNVGGSYQNNKKREIVSSMPEWMKPSGAFGIGLQSAFLLSPELNFVTKSVLTSEVLDIRLTTPLGDELGLSQIKCLSDDFKRSAGTKLVLNIMLDSITYVFGPRRNMFSEFSLGDFDPIRHKEFPFEAHTLAEKIFSSAKDSLVPVFINLNGVTLKAGRQDLEHFVYDEEHHVSLKLKFVPNGAFAARISFRGQELDKYSPRFSFVEVEANFLGGSAQSLLTVNRESIRDEARAQFAQTLRSAIAKVVARFTPKDDFERIGISAYAYTNKISCDRSLKDHWKKIKVAENAHSIIEILKLDSYIFLHEEPRYSMTRREKSREMPSSESGVLVDYSKTHSPEMRLLLEEWAESGNFVQEDFLGNGFYSLKLTSKKCDNLTISGLAQKLKTPKHSSRLLMPLIEGYEDLAISDNVDVSMFSDISSFGYRDSLIVAPFYFSDAASTDGFDELCEWVHSNSNNKAVSLHRIRDLYIKLIDWIDDEVMRGEKKWQRVGRTPTE
ncbi:HD domain-containing protein [Pseudomonas fluorescens]|uniref:HD domain-containing protein n=1 Tax=Pseudomonas fluorescens TaxID=294 RepID=UPI001A9F085B|nr:ATP-binding protein [Pseudomonas fluorescens]QTD30633.1 ATP-binding protein [Pseudomonas fluorescens]